MKKEYDFSNAKPNPYASQLKKTITIRIDEESISYFKELAEETGLPYQSLINLYLKDCATNKRKPDIKWNKQLFKNYTSCLWAAFLLEVVYRDRLGDLF